MKTALRRWLPATLLLSLLSLLINACLPPAPPTAVTEKEALTALRVTALPYLSFAPLYIAQEEGFFAAQGLDVELVRFQRNSESLTALLRNEVDVDSIFTVGLLNAIARGENIKMVANKGVLIANGCPADGFMLRSGLEIKQADLSAEVLRSLRYGVDPTWVDSYLLQQVLTQYGVDISEVVTEYVPDPAARVEALRQGSLDVAFLSEPWISRAQESSAASIWIPAAEIAPAFPFGMLIFGPSLLAQTDDTGVRFLRAYLMGIAQYNKGKTQRNLEIVEHFSQLEPQLLNTACWPTFSADGYVDAAAIAEYAAWVAGLGLADRALAPNEFWDPQFLDQVSESTQ